MSIHPDTLASIKARIDIQEIISDFLPLKKRGSGHTYWGCCPFHNERTPSFAVNADKGFYKCFGCGKGGDTITFLQQKEGMTYVESMRYLADKYGIAWQETSSAQQTKVQEERQKLHILLEIAADYYQDQLAQSPQAQAYLQKRHIPPTLAEKFKLGYSTTDWQGFYHYAQSKGYTEELPQHVGLLIHKENKIYDRLRGRLTFPLRNSSGQIVGISGRILEGQGKEPKYVNPPETPVYQKSEYLYGLYEGKKQIRSQKNCYLVEGYTDVLALHRAGIEAVVASSGTSLTEAQAQLLKRFTPKATLLFDGDEAGIKAILRGIDLLVEVGLEVKVVLLPTDQDPDTYLSQYGAEALQNYLTEKSQDFITFKIYHLLNSQSNDPEQRTAALQSIIQTLSIIPDPIKRSVYTQLTHKLTALPLDTLEESIQKRIRQSHRKEGNKEKKGSIISKKDADKQNEEVFLYFLIQYGDQKLEDGKRLATYLLQELEEVNFRTEHATKILEHFRKAYQADSALSTAQFIESLPEDLKEKVIHIISNRFELSEGWKKRYHIFTPKTEEAVLEIIQRNLLHRKKDFIQELLREQRLLMAQAQTDEELDLYLSRQAQIKELDIEVRKKLGVPILATQQA